MENYVFLGAAGSQQIQNKQICKQIQICGINVVR